MRTCERTQQEVEREEKSLSQAARVNSKAAWENDTILEMACKIKKTIGIPDNRYSLRQKLHRTTLATTIRPNKKSIPSLLPSYSVEEVRDDLLEELASGAATELTRRRFEIKEIELVIKNRALRRCLNNEAFRYQRGTA